MLSKGNTKKSNDTKTKKFNQSIELASEFLVAYYYPMADKLHKDYLEAQDRLNKGFDSLSDEKDKEELKRIKLSEGLWEQRKITFRENTGREAARINWIKAFNSLVRIVSVDEQKEEVIDCAVNWIKTVFIKKLLTYNQFTDAFRSENLSGWHDLNLSPLQSLVEEKNSSDEVKCSNSGTTDLSEGTENITALSYDPETVFIALWYMITRDDYHLSNL